MGACKIFVDNGQMVIQEHLLNYPYKYETLVIAKMLTIVTLVGCDQHVRNQTWLKVKHTCKLLNFFNRDL